ncbi:D-glycero-beta-D-manno-heptose-7-phosphate kinase [Candidatus Poribacteria bacterium]|nr:D-glycero-beta-D-manno-heptose-7-phosphate kinase [Candidatus Poribacteria bacterium]
MAASTRSDDQPDDLALPSAVRVLVLGDVILDSYLRGQATRISAEAPVPIIDVESEEYRLGGAANVAANITALGASCDLIGAVGDDEAGKTFRKLLAHAGISDDSLVTDPSRPTSHKTRVLARNQQVLRLDRESRAPIDEGARALALERLSGLISTADAVIIEDYDKGLLDEALIVAARDEAKARGIPVVVDPKLENFWHYGGVTCVTPNVYEAGAAVKRPIATGDDLRRVGAELVQELDLDHLLITRGADGVALFERAGSGLTVTHVPAAGREVYDVTGAGDTAVAVYTLGLAAGMSPRNAARLANYAGGLVVGHLGCVSVDRDELSEAIRLHADADLAHVRVETA